MGKINFTNSYFVNIFSVAIGTIISQIIPILVSPILTRIYTPDDFGLYAVFMSIVSICVTISSARYDLAIFLPKNIENSKKIFIITIIINFFFLLISIIILLIFKDKIISLLDVDGLDVLIFTIPLIVFLISFYQNYILWLNRNNQYSIINFYKIFYSVLLSTFNLIFGFFKFKYNGLIQSVFVTQIILNLFSFYKIKFFFYSFNLKYLKILAVKYKNFPLYSLPSTFSGEFGAQLPVFFFTYFFNQAITGYYLLATKIISLPFSVIGNSIATVYRQKAIEEFNLFGKCDKVFISTFKKIFFVCLIPVLIIFFGSEWMFEFYFGSEWIVAGRMASYLSVLVFFQLLSTPMADTILFVGGQRIDFVLQFLRLVLTTLSFVIGTFFNDYELCIILFVFSYSVYYLLHSIIQFRIARGLKIYKV